MVRGHQIFLIARIIPHGQTKAQYRCIAAIYHQSCYGTLPLKATRRFLTLIKQKDNAEIIREEIRSLHGKYGRWRQQPSIPPMPAPYCSFLLASAWCLNFENPFHPHVSGPCYFLYAEMGSSEGDNNDGITVIDITDPENAAYCFISFDDLLYARDTPEELPLPAMDYLRIYHHIPDAVEMEDKGVQIDEATRLKLKIISSLDGEPLVTGRMLAEAWPNEYRAFPQEDDEEGNASLTVEKPTNISSLTELSLKPAIKSALQNDAAEEIEPLIWMPGKAEAIMAELKTYNPFPDSGISLLAKLMRQQADEHILDLSHLFLSSEQIVTLLMGFEGTEVLKLSHNPLVTIDTVRTVLNIAPNMRRLVLLDTAITNEDLARLMLVNKELFFRLEALTHPLLYEGKVAYPSAFTFLEKCDNKVLSALLPFFTPAQIVQSLAEYLPSYLEPSFHSWDTLEPQAVFSTTVRKKGQSWNERTVPFYARASKHVFKDEGWYFAFNSANFCSCHQYAFIKIGLTTSNEEQSPVGAGTNPSAGVLEVDPGTPSYKVYDLHCWLEEMEREGRPSVPIDAVELLTTIFGALNDSKDPRFTLMEPIDIDVFIVRYHKALERQKLIESSLGLPWVI